MPLMQHMQQVQSHQTHSAPYYVQQHFEKQLNQEITTVQQTEQQKEKEQIREDDEDRGAQRHGMPRRRAKTSIDEEQTVKTKPKDGIHGRFLDIQA